MISNGYNTNRDNRLNDAALGSKVCVDARVNTRFGEDAELSSGRLAAIAVISLLLLDAIAGHNLVGFLTHL
ncbi:MAG: high light inducible protein [Cyanobacteriota bacterium]|nr:high light inducible protein [Cyanobacteriota bacterium]